MANAISSVLDKQIFQHKKINSVIRLPLQEQDLLTLHEKFVTVGFH